MAAASAAPPRGNARRTRSPFPATTPSASRPRLDRLLGFVSIVVLLGHGRIVYFPQAWWSTAPCAGRDAFTSRADQGEVGTSRLWAWSLCPLPSGKAFGCQRSTTRPYPSSRLSDRL